MPPLARAAAPVLRQVLASLSAGCSSLSCSTLIWNASLPGSLKSAASGLQLSSMPSTYPTAYCRSSSISSRVGGGFSLASPSVDDESSSPPVSLASSTTPTSLATAIVCLRMRLPKPPRNPLDELLRDELLPASEPGGDGSTRPCRSRAVEYCEPVSASSSSPWPRPSSRRSAIVAASGISYTFVC